MTVLDRLAERQGYAQAGAEEGLLDVVGRQRVAREEHLDPALLDQPGDVAGRAGVDDRRAAHEQDLLPLGAGRPDRVDHAPDADRLGLLARNGRAHEAEHADFTRPFDRQHAHPRMADHDRHADRHVAHRNAARLAAGAVDDDPAVHLLVVDVDPAAAETDLGRLVGRAVKPFGKRTGDVGRDHRGVFGMNRRGAVLDQIAQDGLEHFLIVGPDRDPRIARIGAAHADLALADLERAAHQQDAIQDLGQEQRVDDVTANLDLLDHARRAWYG